MLAIDNLTVHIQRAEILRGIRLRIPSGEVAGLIGRNGAGKTTLMRAVMGLLPIAQGSIVLDDAELVSRPAHARARLAVGYMPEDRRLVPTFTVEENVMLPVVATRGRPDPERLRWVYGLMPEVQQFASRKALQLSGGQQKLVALARALMCGRKLLLLDEPFEGVAPALAQRLVEVIGRLRGGGVTVLLSESDYTHSVDLLDHLFVIERGAVEERTLDHRRDSAAPTNGASS
ncbi:MAG: ATP-binding cassette domain-containing protein [Hyphomicrobiaceae bacterium]|nr:MAG: ATP-binding cassette domain-containing protein [Hyphomicrobiaceae bacterium]